MHYAATHIYFREVSEMLVNFMWPLVDTYEILGSL